MRKIILSAFILLTVICQAQEKQEVSTSQKEGKIFYVLKTKLGISQLELFDSNFINGNITQIDFLFSSKLSNKFRLEYGLGASQFTGNNVNALNKYVSIKNNNLRLPVNLLYNRDFNKNISLIYGVGLYGNYLTKADIQGYYDGSNVGLNLGWSVQIGANFKISDDFDFRVFIENQRDITKISKANNIEIREKMNTLIGLNFVYKL